MRPFFTCVLAVWGLLAAIPLHAAQDAPAAVSPGAQQQTPPKPPPVVEGQRQPPKPGVVTRDTSRAPRLANVRLEVTITDQRGAGTPATKTVALVLADRANGRIRTTGEAPVQIKLPGGGGATNYQMRPIVLNVDARPEITTDNRVKADVTLEYRPTPGEGTNDEQQPTTISESLTVILEDGKPLVVSQSADPNTDRRVRVEVKATILK